MRDPPTVIAVASVPPVSLKLVDGGAHTPWRDTLGRSYEEALAELDTATSEERDLTSAELIAPTRDASFIKRCGAPDAMQVTVKVVIRDGQAVGVTVTTRPTDRNVEQCADAHVRGLAWPAARPASFTTRY